MTARISHFAAFEAQALALPSFAASVLAMGRRHLTNYDIMMGLDWVSRGDYYNRLYRILGRTLRFAISAIWMLRLCRDGPFVSYLQPQRIVILIDCVGRNVLPLVGLTAGSQLRSRSSSALANCWTAQKRGKNQRR